MAQNSKANQDAANGELPQKVVNAVKHHIRVMQVTLHRIGDPSKHMSKIGHGKSYRSHWMHSTVQSEVQKGRRTPI